jgi:hypothetical protein
MQRSKRTERIKDLFFKYKEEGRLQTDIEQSIAHNLNVQPSWVRTRLIRLGLIQARGLTPTDRSQAQQAPRQEAIYVIEWRDSTGIHLVKIGYSAQVEARFAGLQALSPVTLVLSGAVRRPDARKVERDLHEQLRSFNHHAEWYNVTPKVRAALNRLGITISP